MSDIDDGATPRCLAIVPDGNRRWARNADLSSVKGHKKGYEKFQEVMSWAQEANIKTIAFYALSTENIQNRSPLEVSYLMRLLKTGVRTLRLRAHREHIRVEFIGNLYLLKEELVNLLLDVQNETFCYNEFHLIVAIAYGGRAELLYAAQSVRRAGVCHESDLFAGEHVLRKFLWSRNVPDVDLLIRTGGRRRLSNFLPYQTAYSELYFTDTLWPDFSRNEFNKALLWYKTQQRNFGK